MAEIVEFLVDEQLQIGLVVKADKQRLTVNDLRDRSQKVAPDKVLFRHSGRDLSEVLERLARLQREVDVRFLWEALQEEQQESRDAQTLAQLFFDADDALHSSAIFRALVDDRLHFRRRGRTFEARSSEEIEQLRQQQQAEARAAAEIDRLRNALVRSTVDDELARRLTAFVRGQVDRNLETALAELARVPHKHAFTVLVMAGRVPATTDVEVFQAGLRRDHPPEVIEHAERWAVAPEVAGVPQTALFSIDDPETREVDDALSLTEDGALVRVDIDIADAACFVQAGDVVDREARRRATSVYLPPATYYMLPDVIGVDRGSLQAGALRPALRTSVWIDEAQGEVVRHALCRQSIRVERRLDYEQADQLISGADDGAAHDQQTAVALRRLSALAGRLRQRRVARGALLISRREWKIRVDDEGSQISVKPTPADSPSRALVAEMMILANSIAAALAVAQGVPLIFRVQPPPVEPLPSIDPADPAGFARLRGLIVPAKLSLHPDRHAGLGLDAYTQVTSPLRRYADLVQQRQLTAHLAGEPPPYSAEDLLKVLAAVESTDLEMKRIETAVTQRWALEHVARGRRAALEGWIVGETPTGYRAQLAGCGASGLLGGGRKQDRALGERVLVDVEEVKPRRGLLRLRLADDDS